MKLTEFLLEAKPYILRWIEEQKSGVGGFAPTPHDLSSGHHTGSLSDGQAPQFLKTDGSRSLIGSLTVSPGILIDGIDLSVLGSDFSAHDSADAVTAHGTVGAHNHQSAGAGGQLDHGLALSGLADDDHTQYASANGSGTRSAYQAEQLNKSVLAGNGLTNGGLLTADVTLNVGAGTGISVGADTVGLNLAANLTWTGAHVFQGSLTTRTILPELVDTYDLGSSTLLWRKGWLSELDAILFAQNTITLLGGWLLISKDEGALYASVVAADTTIDFGKAMTVGDFVLFRAALKVEYVLVGSLVSGNRYNVTRNLDGSGSNDWPAGTPFAVLGQSGQGRIELNAYDTPRIQLLKQGTSYNAQTEIIRIGDLTGNWGSTKWGIAIGEYSAAKANIVLDEDGILKIRSGSVDRVYLTSAGVLTIQDMGGAAVFTFDASSGAEFSKPLTLGTAGGIYQGTGSFSSPTTGLKIWNDSGIGRIATYNAGVAQVYFDTAGKLKAGADIVILDASGIVIKNGPSEATSLTFKNSSNKLSGLLHSEGRSDYGLTMEGSHNSYYDGAGAAQLYLVAHSSSYDVQRYTELILTSQDPNVGGENLVEIYSRQGASGITTRLKLDGILCANSSMAIGSLTVTPADKTLALQSLGSWPSSPSGFISLFARGNSLYSAEGGIVINLSWRATDLFVPLSYAGLRGFWVNPGFDNLTSTGFGLADLGPNHFTLPSFNGVSGYVQFGTRPFSLQTLNGINQCYYRAITANSGFDSANYLIGGFWVYLSSVSRSNGVASAGNSTANAGWTIGYYWSGAALYAYFGIYDTGGTWREVTNIQISNTAGWHYIGFIYSWVSSSSYSMGLYADWQWSWMGAGGLPLAMRTPSSDFILGWSVRTGTYLHGAVMGFVAGTQHDNSAAIANYHIYGLKLLQEY